MASCRQAPRAAWRVAAHHTWPLLIACVLAGCGKKGPPLPPLVRVPEPVVAIDARRIGQDVYVTITVPARNVDGMSPADVGRIEVMAATGTELPSPQGVRRDGSRVASVPVAPPPREDEADEEPATGVRPPAPGEATQGNAVTIRETLTPAAMAVAGAAPESSTSAPAEAAAASGKTSPGAPPQLQRFYTAVAISPRGRTSGAGGIASVLLGDAPRAPAGLDVAYTSDTLSLTWMASAGAEGYNVYVAPSPGDDVPPAQAEAIAAPVPANEAPLEKPSFTQAVQFGVLRCFRVSALRSAASNVESAPSEPVCTTPRDTFPPEPPAGLNAVALDGGLIELRWEPSPAADVAGYVVLRGTADETPRVVTPEPVTGTRFVDREVTAGTRYVYEVVAVDGAEPPNRSVPSEADDATAR